MRRGTIANSPASSTGVHALSTRLKRSATRFVGKQKELGI
jgi:hypothetical protein